MISLNNKVYLEQSGLQLLVHFAFLTCLVLQDDLDFLIIAETKLDSSFSNSQFLVKGYKPPFRLDVSDTSGGLLVYIKNGLSRLFFLKTLLCPTLGIYNV